MDEFLYLEADEEITSVIDKLKGLEAKSVGLVVPKGSTIAQSLVSLKLIKKQSESLSKDIAIITSDEVGQNLAMQIELPVYPDVKSKIPLKTEEMTEPDTDPIKIDMSKETAKNPIKEDKKEDTEKKEEIKSEVVKEEKADQESTPLADSDFVVRRYDESGNQEGAEKPVEEIAEEAPAEPVRAMEPTINRQEIESERPIRYEDKVAPKIEKNKRAKAIIFVRVFSIVFAILIGIFFVSQAITKVAIAVSVPAETYEKEIPITVEKDRNNSDVSQGIIPGSFTTTEEAIEKTINSTGEKEIGEKAKGSLVFKNNDGSDQSISSGTIVKSSSGVEFILDSNITVPKAQVSMGQITLGKVNGPVTAKASGTGSNMSANTVYAVTGKPSLSAEGSTSGGTTKKVKIVTKSDIDRAREELKSSKQDSSTATKEDDIIALDGSTTIELNDFSTSKNAQDEADNFVAKGKLKVMGLAFKKKDFQDIVIQTAEKEIPEGKALLLSDTDKIEPSLEEANINIGKLKVKAKITSHIGPKLDFDKMKNSWKLKPIKNIKADLSQIEGLDISKVDITPKYTLPLSPIFSKNTTIKIEYTKK